MPWAFDRLLRKLKYPCIADEKYTIAGYNGREILLSRPNWRYPTMNTAKNSRVKSFAIIAAVSTLLWGCGADDKKVQLTAQQEKQVAERIAPVGHVAMAGQVVAAATTSAGAARSGSDIYSTNCVACHSSGVAGAPKLGDVAAWALRLEQGLETVYANAINGIRAMPARGTCMSCSDDEVKAAIDHILDNSK
jgi:cytochrome c5